MSYELKNEDFVIQINDNDQDTLDIVNKYEDFLAAITDDNFGHVRDAIKTAIHFFVSKKYISTNDLASEFYNNSDKLKAHYSTIDQYLEKIPVLNKKSATLDLATGAGKSWVMYGVAQIMLAEGLVDKVLVLCPSLTIEESLKNKFEELAGDSTVSKILEELGAVHKNPSIKNANEDILEGDICIENIHAVYERTGSSIEASFKSKGQRTLVLSDEAHHIYSQASDITTTKKWEGFLTDEEYGFQYLLGVTGTPYFIGSNDYFHDIIYRFSLKQAMDLKVVKSIDYKSSEADQEKGWQETFSNHNELQEKYAGVLKPLTIVITSDITRCIEVWHELVAEIVERDRLSREEAEKKVIWITSGVPSSGAKKKKIESILEKAESKRKENLQLLKTVDDEENPVEWIVSVSMLTEGWDVKNVFQIVPHEERAFNSKLLISQVLGRGLRVPSGLDHHPVVRINNHERWTDNIKKLYDEVLEMENRISWGYDPNRSDYEFELYNIDYKSVKQTEEVKKKAAKDPTVSVLADQYMVKETQSTYSLSGTKTFNIEVEGNVNIDVAVRQIKLFLKQKDEKLSKKWSSKKIKEFIQNALEETKGYKGDDLEFLSKENLQTFKQAFGPMFRKTGKKVIRMKLSPDSLVEIKMAEMQRQSFSEHSIKDVGKIYYTDSSGDILPGHEKAVYDEIIGKVNNFDTIKVGLEALGHPLDEIQYLKNNFSKHEELKTPQNLIFVSYNPEKQFAEKLVQNQELFDGFIKSPDRGFYQLPYSYKPTEKGSSHVKRDNFNPDFILKLKDKNEVLIVEIKMDDDISKENKAKHREAKAHFKELNKRLKAADKDWTYFFYFLSPNSYDAFIAALKKEDQYKKWKSDLMQKLETK